VIPVIKARFKSRHSYLLGMGGGPPGPAEDQVVNKLIGCSSRYVKSENYPEFWAASVRTGSSVFPSASRYSGPGGPFLHENATSETIGQAGIVDGV
jgi:hypothetical protein